MKRLRACLTSISAVASSAVFLGSVQTADTQTLQEAARPTVIKLPAAASVSLLVGGAIRIPAAEKLDGSPFDIGAVKGYKVVYFFLTTCPTVSRCEQLTFKPLSKKYMGKVSFFALASSYYDNHLNRSELASKLASHHLPYPLLLDPSHSIANTLGGIAASQAILLSADNKVLYTGQPDNSLDTLLDTGAPKLTKPYLENAIDQALAGKPIKIASTRPMGCTID